MTNYGTVRQARRGAAWPGLERHGGARQASLARPSVAWRCAAQARRGVARCGELLAGRDEFWQGRHGRHGKTSPGWVWQGPALRATGRGRQVPAWPGKARQSAWHGEAEARRGRHGWSRRDQVRRGTAGQRSGPGVGMAGVAR